LNYIKQNCIVYSSDTLMVQKGTTHIAVSSTSWSRGKSS